MFFSCSDPTLEDFRHEGEAVSRQLVIELKKIRSRDDLIERAPHLQELFNRLVDVMIQARAFKDTHSDPATESLVLNKEQTVSDQLRIELNRVLHMEGGREVIEKAQETALSRLESKDF